jgi:hypothetical protein
MLSEESIKQIFFYCDQHEPNAVVADDVDIYQFAQKVAAFVQPMIALKEHQRCVKIVKDMNTEVARALENQRPTANDL